MKVLALLMLSAGLSACAAVPDAAGSQPACAAAVFPDDQFVAPAFTDKFNGRYANGGRFLDIRREGERLYIGPPGGPWRQLRRTSEIPGEGAFRDGCGADYRIVLPPDGPGAWLTIVAPDGTRSEWHRS